MDATRATSASIRALLHAFDPGSELLHVSRPAEGLASEVYFLGTRRSELVLKVFDDEAGAWKPQKELAIQSLMRGLGIPSANVLRVDVTKTVVPFSYTLAERIGGNAYSRVLPSLSVEENSSIYRQLGDYLGRLHATTFPQFGDVLEQDGQLVVGPARELAGDADDRWQGPFSTWLEMHGKIVEHRVHLMEGTEFGDLIPQVERYFRERAGEIDFAIVPRLLHMDLHPGNILVQDGEITGILDLEESIVGHNEYDLMRTKLANFRGHDPAYERAFMDAYADHLFLDEGYLSRKHFYDVSRTLAWVRSLILNAHRYSRDQAHRYRQAAHSHMLALLTDGT